MCVHVQLAFNLNLIIILFSFNLILTFPEPLGRIASFTTSPFPRVILSLLPTVKVLKKADLPLSNKQGIRRVRV